MAWNVLLDTLTLSTIHPGSETSNNDASTSARVTMSVMENITTIEFIHQKMNWESHKVAIHFWHQLRVSTIATNLTSHQDNNSSHLASLVTALKMILMKWSHQPWPSRRRRRRIALLNVSGWKVSVFSHGLLSVLDDQSLISTVLYSLQCPVWLSSL